MAEELTVIEGNASAPEKITSVKINDGTRRIPFVNQDDEEIGVLRFRPADPGIIGRYDEAVKRWPELLETLESESAEESDPAETYHTAKARLFEILDFLLARPVSREIFAHIDPFAPVGDDGAMFFEVVMDTVQAVIEQEFSVQLARRAEREKKMAKYRPNRQQRRATK